MVAAGCAAPAPGPAPAAPANLLLITLDTVRADRIGAYGYPAAETPHLDRLAREGLRFEQAAATAPLTLPSHATILTGLLPSRHGVRNNGAGALSPTVETLATRLSAAGYRTGAFVGSFVLDRRFGLARGFATYDDEIERGPRAGSLEAERPGSLVVDRALAWLARLDDPRPFFAWVHLYDAHAPYAPAPPFSDRHPGRPYDAEIASVDHEVGRLLAGLGERAARTVVAVTADHGEGLGDHGELTHGLLLYESTLRVPLLLTAPGFLPAGRSVADPVSLADLAPTLAGVLGLEFAPPQLAGRDLGAALRDGGRLPRADLYAETEYPRSFGWSALAALRRGDLKYIAAPRPEVYDLGADAAESRNLLAEDGAAAPELQARLAALRGGEPAPTVAAPGDSEMRARLASLGYLGAGTAAPPSDGRASKDPKDMVGLFQGLEQARQAMEDGRLVPAAEQLAQLVAADPANPVFRGTLAEALRRAGRRREAIPLYREVVATIPEDPQAWYNLAVTLQEAGEADEAARALAEALRRDPGHPEAHNARGIALALQGRVREAHTSFARAVELDPRNARAHNNLGNAWRDLGRLAEAEASYRRAIELAPRYADPLNGLGTLEVQSDRPAAAISYFDRALALAPGLHEVRLHRAIAYELLGDRDTALAGYRDFLAASAADPQFTAQRRAARQLVARLSQHEPAS